MNYQKLVFPTNVTRFTLEDQIMKCWGVLDQIDTVIEGTIEYDWTPDQTSNALLGIKEIYQLEFNKLIDLQTALISNGTLK